MAKMGSYCKAYSVQRLREFEGWTDSAQTPFADGTYLYVQDNFTVTEGIFMDESIIFSALTPEWIQFCQVNLAFEVPVN